MKKILVTGSNRGIGFAHVKQLAKNRNMEIVGTSTSGNYAFELPNFKCLPLDLGNLDSIEKFSIQVKGLDFDYLVNNAAVLLEKWGESLIDFEKLEQTFQINLFGTIRLTELLLPQIHNSGHIINISSGWGSFSEANFDEYEPHYKMSKAALNMYTKLLSMRLQPKMIKVSSFDPGWVRTDMGGNAAPRKPDIVAREIIELMNNDVKSGYFWHKGNIRGW